MRRLQNSLSVRMVAWMLFFLSACLGGLFGQRTLTLLPYLTGEDIEASPAWKQMFNRSVQQLERYLQYQVILGDPTLDYVARQQYQQEADRIQRGMESDGTNFRVEVLSMDGKRMLYHNTEWETSLEDRLYSVHYGMITVQNGVVSIYMKESPSMELLDYSPGSRRHTMLSSTQDFFILRCGVLKLEHQEVEDIFQDFIMIRIQSEHQFPFYITGTLLCWITVLGLLLFLLWSMGHDVNHEEIVLTWKDRIFTEVYLLLLGGSTWLLIGFIRFQWMAWWYYLDPWIIRIFLILAALFSTGWATILGITLGTITIRLKASTILTSTLLTLLGRRAWRKLMEILHWIPTLWKIPVGFLLYLLIHGSLVYCFPQYRDVIDFLTSGLVFVILLWWTSGFWRVCRGAELIAGGNLNHQIDTTHLPSELKNYAEVLNHISDGLTHAMDEQMKSERFKAELITNVSHDLKTPLTSILNYVNLLKTTRQTDPTAMQYIEVLDRKSQRLKKLTEDLVEASKASTGVLTVNREMLGMIQLLDQALGEHEEKLKMRQLTVVQTLPPEETYVYADGRHLWRVIDNLLVNCAKYALEGTRIYVDLCLDAGTVTLSIKNISREPLNLPAEQLMERFVRGETSRTTEGSGLGLSIARSLTEIQGGSFHLAVDGDLFKAVVTLPQSIG